MNCPHCGAGNKKPGAFCTSCGKPLAQPAALPQQEKTLHAFGPMGISITFGRPGAFAWAKKNVTRVLLTDRRLCGVKKRALLLGLAGGGGETLFDVPLASVTALEVVNFLANKALYVRYNTPAGPKEVSVVASLLLHGDVLRLHQLMTELVANR